MNSNNNIDFMKMTSQNVLRIVDKLDKTFGKSDNFSFYFEKEVFMEFVGEPLLVIKL